MKLLNPVGRGLRYFCIGVNYPERNEEYKDGSERPKYPSIFMRSHTSFSAPGEPIVRPRESEQLDYEGEIVIVIGQGGRRIPEADAMSHVFALLLRERGLGAGLAAPLQVQRHAGEELRSLGLDRPVSRDGGRSGHRRRCASSRA